MATYFHGGSEIQENLQTLYLMNPNFSYIAAYSDTQNSHPQSNMLLLNALSQGSIPHAPPHQPPGHPFIAIPLSDNFNPGRPSSSTSPDHHDGRLLHGFSSVSQQGQGLSLSLSPQHRNPVVSVAVANPNGVAGGVILGSKYLKPTQELLNEVVSVGYEKVELGSGAAHNEKGKEVAAGGERSSGGDADESNGGSKSAAAAEKLSPAQRQEIQMKKAKLLNMLDEVEQRYREYHSQMQAMVSSLEQAAGMGSAKSYTSLALKTISRQFRCLKDAITSQIRETNKSLGEEDHHDQDGVKLESGIGSRLRLVDHQLRQQKALQQLGMMPSNAWRPQRGLPERAVSVLRAWLFEHFLHPYPKDSDKHMLAKQTGLTRSQVSNWFINARVRLWKPMVEEMYLEEMKAHGQNGDNSDNTTTANNQVTPENHGDKDHRPASKPTTMAQQQEQQQHQYEHHGMKPGMMRAHQQPGPETTNDVISSDMDSLIGTRRSPKRQWNNNINNSDMHSSPSSILSTDMEIKPPDNQAQLGPGGTGFNPVYCANNIPGRFNQLDHLTGPYGNNGVSLTLGLPRCENLLSPHSGGSHDHQQQGFLDNQGMQQLERRLEVGAQEANFWGIRMGQPLHQDSNDAGYESIDIQSHKRFAAHQLLHDFVA